MYTYNMTNEQRSERLNKNLPPRRAIVDTTMKLMEQFVELGKELTGDNGVTIIIIPSVHEMDVDYRDGEVIHTFDVHSEEEDQIKVASVIDVFGDGVWTLQEWGVDA